MKRDRQGDTELVARRERTTPLPAFRRNVLTLCAPAFDHRFLYFDTYVPRGLQREVFARGILD